MKITFLGTGVGIPQTGRVQSGLMTEIDGELLLLDCGCGVLGRIVEAGYRHTDVHRVMLTHLHLDHAGDLLALLKARWLSDVGEMIHVYGPRGTQAWFTKILAPYGYLHDRFNMSIVELEGGEGISLGACTIRCMPSVHSISSLAYRVEHGGRALVYTGDTEPSEKLFTFAKGADMLIHECSFPLGFTTTNHTTPDMLTAMMEKVALEVKQLVLTHFYPHMQGHEEEALTHIRKYFKAKVSMAVDLMQVEL